MRSVPASLYRKTLASLLLAIAVVILTAGIMGSRALERQAIRHLTASLTTAARVMAPQVRDALAASREIGAVQPLAAALGRQAGCRVTIIDADGAVLGDSEQTEAAVRLMENHGQRPEVVAAAAGQVGTSLRYSRTVRHPMLYVALPLPGGEGRPDVLRVAVPVTVVAELRGEIRRTIVASLLVGVILAVVLGAWLTRRVTTPLRRLTEAAGAYARGELDRSMPSAAVQEVDELASTLRTMAQALRARIDELTTERNQATAIVESLAEGVVALDARGRLLLVNPAAASLLDLPLRDATGRNVFETVRSRDVQALCRVVLEGRRRSSQDLTIFQPRERALRIHGVPCEGGGPDGPRAVLVIQDVTASHRYEQLRKEFVANVSHELKSPLTSIRGLTETLLEGALADPANNRRFVELIDQDSARLSRLIDDLLALSQIESQAVPLRRSLVELKPLAEAVVASLQPSIARRRLRVAVDLPAGLAAYADPDRLRQVFSNLLDNAVKYNKDGGTITVSATADHAAVAVTVADTGLGIPEADLPRIFERFYRVDKARSRELGGTGLGLAIVKHIVEAHGGRVSVESRLNRGSVFSLTLPLLS